MINDHRKVDVLKVDKGVKVVTKIEIVHKLKTLDNQAQVQQRRSTTSQTLSSIDMKFMKIIHKKYSRKIFMKLHTKFQSCLKVGRTVLLMIGLYLGPQENTITKKAKNNNNNNNHNHKTSLLDCGSIENILILISFLVLRSVRFFTGTFVTMEKVDVQKQYRR